MLLLLSGQVLINPVVYVINQSTEHHVADVFLNGSEHVQRFHEQQQFDGDETKHQDREQAVSYVVGQRLFVRQ